MDLKYEIALCSVWWKKGDTDNRLFDSINEQKAYFDNKIAYWSPLSNFPLNDNSVTTISFKDLSSRTIEEVIENNYAVVKKTIDGVETYRYYFAHLFQDSGRVFVCDLELDNIQTNYISIRNALNPCFIRRATIDRFKSDGYFNLEPDSKMFIPEGTSHQQRLIKRERLKVKYTGNEVIDNWLYENVAGWLYLYVDNSTQISVLDLYDSFTSWQVDSSLNIKYAGETYSCPYGVLCAPVYKGFKKIYVSDSNHHYNELSIEGLNAIAKANSLLTNGRGYGYKFSPVPPFTYGSFKNEENYIHYERDSGDLFIIGEVNSDDTHSWGIFTSYDPLNELPYYRILKGYYGSMFCRSNVEGHGCIFDTTQTTPYYDFEIDLSNEIELNPNPVGALKDKKFNPKLLNGDYRKLRLVCENNYYEYFMDKLDNNIFNGKYSENIVIGQNKCYARISDGLYIKETLNNYTGCVANYDSSLPLVKDKWDEFIANNKNYFLQTGLSYTLGLVKSGFNMVGQNYLKAMGGALDSWESMAQAIINKDNMENAPQSLAGVSGDPIFILQAHDLGAYYEYYECLDYEMEIDNDYMYFNGYQVNTYGRIQDLDHNRKYFDYIQAEIDVIPVNINNDEKKSLSQIFRQGIRLWHTDNFEGYTYENYERSLE